MDHGVEVVIASAPDESVARNLVETLVGERHAACGSMIPGMTSVYWWDDAVQTDSEVLVLLKTTSANVDRLIERAREIHPYEVPELLVLPVRAGNHRYLEWVARETSGGTPG